MAFGLAPGIIQYFTDDGIKSGYILPITIKHTEIFVVGGSLTNYPFYLWIGGSGVPYLKDVSNGGLMTTIDASDVAFYADSGLTTLLKWEIVGYDPANGKLYAYITIPELDNLTDVTFYMYFGDPDNTFLPSDTPQVWAGYDRVYHLNQINQSSVTDSTGNYNGLVSYGQGLQIDTTSNFYPGSLLFDGAGYINAGALVTDGSFTISFFINIDTPQPNQYNNILGSLSLPSNDGIGLYDTPLGRVLGIGEGNTTTTYDVSTGSDFGSISYYAIIVDTNSLVKVYKNNVVIVTGVQPSIISTGDFYLGKIANGVDILNNAIMFNFRYSNLIRTEGDIKTEYNIISNLSKPRLLGTVTQYTGLTYYQRSVTIDYTLCGSSDSTDLPVLVSIDDSSFKSFAHGGNVAYDNGNDITFYADSGMTTLLKWDVVSYDSTNGKLIAWVKIPTVSSTGNKVFYMSYGNVNQYSFIGDKTNVWSNSYNRVYHLNSNANDIFAYNGTINNVSFVPGKFDQAAQFDSEQSSNIQAPDTDLPTGTTSRTLSFWALLNSYDLEYPGNPAIFRNIVGYGTAGVGNGAYIVGGPINYLNNSFAFSQWGLDVHTSTASLSTWYYVVMTNNQSQQNNCTIYLNGVGSSATLTVDTVLDGNLYMGMFPSIDNFNGLLSEVRIADVERSIDWITTEYNNQDNPGNLSNPGFLTYGSETAILI